MAKLLISIFLFLFSFNGFCQDQKEKSVILNIGFDIPKLIYSNNEVKKVEGEIGLTINNKWMFINQAGYYNKAAKIEGNYIFIEGYYNRTGFYYIIQRFKYNYYSYNDLGVGMFICNSFFYDKGYYAIKSHTWEDLQIPIERKNWYIPSIEIATMMRKDLFKYFYIKGNVGLRFLLINYNEQARFPGRAWVVPGFGTSPGSIFTPTVNFTFGININFTKQNSNLK